MLAAHWKRLKRCSQRPPICPQIDFAAESGEIITGADKTAQKDAERESRRRKGEAEADDAEMTRNRIRKGCEWRRGGG